jgi:hypothetical protein
MVAMNKPPLLESRPGKQVPPRVIDPKLEALALWMDSAFHIPGLGTRFGLDALIGLVPGVGDTVSTFVSLYILNSARQHGVPRVTLMRMAANVAVDYLLGAVPILGDFFDVYWKANLKNIALLRQHLDANPAQERHSRIGDWLFMGLLMFGLVAILLGSLTLAYFIVSSVARSWMVNPH